MYAVKSADGARCGRFGRYISFEYLCGFLFSDGEGRTIAYLLTKERMDCFRHVN